MRKLVGLLIVLMVIMGSVIIVKASPIDPFIQKGYITVEVDAKYYISDYIWNMANYKTKHNLVLGCSLHHKENTGAQRATIYSMSSGKLIAKYGTFGIKFY